MRWWQKPKTLQHSPFVTLLKLLVTSKENELYTGVKSLLNAVLQDQEMLQTRTSPDALDALIASLEPAAGSVPSTDVLDFVDDCCARFIKVPIKYFDDLDAMCAKASIERADIGPFSSLLMTFVEQWPFKGGESATGPAAEALAGWLSKALYLFNLIGEDEAVLTLVRDSLIESAGKTYKEVLKDAFLWKMYKARAKEALKLATGADFSGSERSSASPVPQTEAETPARTGPVVDLEEPPQEDERHTGLTRWRKKEMEEAIEDGDIGELLLCLCSRHQEIRIQAISNVRQLMASIGVSFPSYLIAPPLTKTGRFPHQRPRRCLPLVGRDSRIARPERCETISLHWRSLCSARRARSCRPHTCHIQQDQQVPDSRARLGRRLPSAQAVSQHRWQRAGR